MSIREIYQAKLESGDITPDPAQARALLAIERLSADLAAPLPGFVQRLLGQAEISVRGLYLYGPVGRGKTMLMDMLYAGAPLEERRRIHFHEFMQEVHARLHEEEGDMEAVASAIAEETRLLCLDEFQVTNVADAMIMARLFAALFENGLVLAATSNTSPDHLYEDGLQRSLFLPFIAVLKKHCEVVPVLGAEDYRRRRLKGAQSWICPENPAALDTAFSLLTDGARGEAIVLDVSGKKVALSKAARGVGCLSLDEMEQQKLWVPEFHELADNYPTLLLSGLQTILPDATDRARRFVTFVDVWYDRQCKLMVSSTVEPEWIYPAGTLVKEFERTVSRLIEMQTEEWWQRPVRPRDEPG